MEYSTDNQVTCHEAQLLISPYVEGDPSLTVGVREAFEAHLLKCRQCGAEYQEARRIIAFMDENKAAFAEALDAVEVEEQVDVERSWGRLEAKIKGIEAEKENRKQIKLSRLLWKVSAAAACLVIGFSAWVMLVNSRTIESPVPQQYTAVPVAAIRIEMLSDSGNIVIPAGAQIRTAADELRTVLVNGMHRIAVNVDTTLSIVPLTENNQIGCLVNLNVGEIFAHVQHDGKPFVVGTPHGKAVITGTTFDVKASNDATVLVVGEGLVRFESENGGVEVPAGHVSEIVAHSAPTAPVSCDAVKITAWAASRQIKTTLAQLRTTSDTYDVTDLWATAGSGPIDLEAIDYRDWVEEERDWFKREFPWIFQLKDALAQENTKDDYPQLLIQSGDIWQFVYPPASPSRVPILNRDSLIKAAARYGFGKQWLVKNVPGARSAIASCGGAKEKFIGLEAFEKWASRLKGDRQSLRELDSEVLLYSLHAGTYLANTKTLLWLSVKNGKLAFRRRDKAKILALVRAEVDAANDLTGEIIRLVWASRSQPCEHYWELADKIIEDITLITRIEKKIAECETGK
jgi:ferric-dicitrate binding protein FerR (iron transport regulator)